MKKLNLTVSLILLSIGLMGCQQSKNEQEENKFSATQHIKTSAEIKEYDFIYRLVTENQNTRRVNL